MANPQHLPPVGPANNLNTGNSINPPNLQIIKPVPWSRTKKTFYIWWIVLLILPLLLSFGSLIGAIVAGNAANKDDRAPADLPLPVVWLLAILQFLALTTLVYYVSVKLRALYARVSAVHQVAAAAAAQTGSNSPSGPGRGSRWLIGFGRRFDSALEMEDWFIDGRNVKGAGIFLGLSTLWILATGAATVAMLVFLVFMGPLGFFGGLGVAVGCVSLLGHLVYVWARSVKVLVLGGCGCCGRRGRRPRQADLEEGDGEEVGERLLPLGADARGGR